MHNKNSFLGSWKLISAEYKSELQTAYPFGSDPEGLLIYDASGWMSVQIMHRDYGQKIAVSDNSKPGNRASFSGYLGYFGTYEIDEANALILHRVAGSTLPHWIGSAQQRSFKFIDGKLILSTPATSKGTEVLAVLEWVHW